MIKRFLVIIAVLLYCLPIPAENIDNGGHAGTPPGFYDDIDPNSLENEENDELPVKEEEQQPQNSYEPTLHEFTDDEEAFFAPPSADSRATKDYGQIYSNLEPADFSYLHNIDPDQYYDMKDTAWSVYPLLRLNSAIYFKNTTIEPGYYLLTPREHNGKWYMLFKQNGIVVHIIPVFERDYTPENFYKEHIPQPKLNGAQKVHMGFLNMIGKLDSTKRREPIESFLEVNDLENHFVSIIIYYGGHKYSTIYRTIRL